MMTPLILKGCKSVQYFITQEQPPAVPGNITQAMQAGWQYSVLWRAQPSATVRTARTENTAAALVPLGLSSVNGATIVSYTKAENMEQEATRLEQCLGSAGAVEAELSRAGERRAQKYAWASSIRVATTLRTFRRTYSHTECMENDMGLN